MRCIDNDDNDFIYNPMVYRICLFPRVALWVVFVQNVLKPDSNLEVVIFTLVAVFIFAVDVLFLCLLEDKN